MSSRHKEKIMHPTLQEDHLAFFLHDRKNGISCNAFLFYFLYCMFFAGLCNMSPRINNPERERLFLFSSTLGFVTIRSGDLMMNQNSNQQLQ